jgi:hypothetical protein
MRQGGLRVLAGHQLTSFEHILPGMVLRQQPRLSAPL